RTGHLLFKHAVVVPPCDLGHGQSSCPCVLEEQAEGVNPLLAGRVCGVNVFVGHGGEHIASLLRATDQDIQASLAALGAQWTEPHGNPPVRNRSTITDRNED